MTNTEINELATKIAARLAELTANDFDVVHCSGGDSKLPQNLRGETPDVARLPTVAECLDCEADTDDIDRMIELAAERSLPTDHPAWTDDLAVHIIA